MCSPECDLQALAGDCVWRLISNLEVYDYIILTFKFQLLALPFTFYFWEISNYSKKKQQL